MATLKKRVRDLRVGDWVELGAHGEIAVTAVSDAAAAYGRPADGRVHIEYLHRYTRLPGWIDMPPTWMVAIDDWPYGDRTNHEERCALHAGAIECGCTAADRHA